MLAEQAGDVQARSSVGTARKSRGKARHEEDLRAAPSSRTRTPAGPPHGTEESRRGRPQSGTAANLGQGTPSRDRDAQEAHRSSPDAERQRGAPSSRGHRAQGQGRVLGRVRATGRRSGNRTGCVHRPRQGRTGGRWQKAEGSVTVSELTHGLLPSTPGVENEVGREARKRFSLNGNAGVRFGTWSQDAADSSETRAAEEGLRALPGAQGTRVKRRAGCAQRA